MESCERITAEITMNNIFDLTGKRILLFGGSANLDKGIAESIKNQGATVQIIEEYNINALEPIINALVNSNGPFNGVVYSIVHSDFRPLQFVKPDNVNQILNDNFSLFVELMRILKKCRGLCNGASIVAMSSISSVRAMKTKTAFCASKAALDAAVRCIAIELATQGIRVNSIQKGGTEADLTKKNIQDMLAVRGESADIKNQQPLGLSTVEEVANVVIFLLSDAVKTITGTSIIIDGGYLA